MFYYVGRIGLCQHTLLFMSTHIILFLGISSFTTIYLLNFCVLSLYVSLRSEFRAVMSVTIST